MILATARSDQDSVARGARLLVGPPGVINPAFLQSSMVRPQAVNAVI
jgi:hypothetical protein